MIPYNKILTLLLGGALFLTGASAVLAQNEPKGMIERQQRWEEGVTRMHQQLNLTPDQEAVLEEHRKTHWQEMKTLFEQIRAKKDELGKALQNPQLDMNQVTALHNQLKDLKIKKEDLRLKGILEVREVLTPEQFAQFMQMKKSFKNKKWGGHKGAHQNKMDASPE